MKKTIAFLFTAVLIALQSIGQTSTGPEATHYRLKYYPKIETGWDYNQIHREELLTLYSDSIYKIEQVHPLGGFEILPGTGTYQVKNDALFLKSAIDNKTRSFKISVTGVTEPYRRERKDLSGILWVKE